MYRQMRKSAILDLSAKIKHGRIGGKPFAHGVGTHAQSTLLITVNGATQFHASVGVDSEEDGHQSSIEFFVWGDGTNLRVN